MKPMVVSCLMMALLASGCGAGGSDSTGDTDNAGSDTRVQPPDGSGPDLPPMEGETAPPEQTVKLVFLHHSTGENWLSDENGGLGPALRDSNYFVSDTNYGWGPNAIGDLTDIGQYWAWFRGPDSEAILDAVYNEGGQNCWYSRLADDPGGENEVVLFKSCFPNSALQGSPDDPVPAIEDNPLREQASDSEHHTVANAKGIYLDLLEYFATRPDKMFVLITAPPLSDSTWAENARALNEWLVNDWLDDYDTGNVFVFDFYNVLTTNGGSPELNDAGSASGNHHRWNGSAVEHITDGDDDDSPNVSEYASGDGDDHPTPAGGQKASAEFVPLLNRAYRLWKAGP